MECPSCGLVNPANQTFCGDCGLHLPNDALRARDEGGRSTPSYTPRHLAEHILKARSALEGERKQVTVLFCDVAESTQMAARLGAERMHGVLNAFFGALALAEAACARATRQGRRVADGSAAEALRLNGICAWLGGDSTRAQRLRKQGIATAPDMNAKLTLARLHHELGTRTADATQLETARLMFAKMWHRLGAQEAADANSRGE